MRFLASFLIAVVCLNVQARDIAPNLINGQPVTDGSFDQVVRIKTNGAGCTATIVGARVIITAAHCGETGKEAKFRFDGEEYTAKLTQSPLYPTKDLDVSVGILDKDIIGANPASIGGKAVIGEEITLLGYGCTKTDGTGGNDGVLRIGKAKITGWAGTYDIVSSTPGGAALCFGDSGGPAFLENSGKFELLGINSKGNIKDTNYNSRLDHKDSLDFLKKIAKDNKVDICGVNANC
jgi:hypothetical protein